jgi:leucyl-tRNA synthetase
MQPYDHKKIEKKWQKEWEKNKIYQALDSSKKPTFYGLFEFPFPSGDGLHVGHMRPYIGMDVIVRKKRMEGHNVLFPIGWDAFGLPTENYAIKTGTHPKIVTKKNTDNFRKQIKAAGPSLDWSREIDTTDPHYYKWTQWIFLQMHKQGLAYKKKMLINWCPKDKIGLANEEVIDGKCERCGTVVEQREKEQWMLAITKYADRLDKDLDTVDYEERIKIQQRNWIGRSEGAEIEFKIQQKDPITFYQFNGSGKIHEGEPYVERNAVMALVKHWSEDKYLGLRWKKVDWETLITGGIEEGQTPEEAARAEIEQETGYKNLKLLRSFGSADSRFYHGPKKQNRFGHFNMFVFQLENGERDQLSEEETKNHEPVWLSRKELESFALPSSHKHLIDLYEHNGKPTEHTLKIFTTRPDTIFGATYVVLAPEHPLVSHYIHQSSNAVEVDAYLQAAKKKDETERTAVEKTKTGVELKGIKAINPATGEAISVYVSDYILAHYGTGAVMAVPAHDERDFIFAKKYNLPIKEVIEPVIVQTTGSDAIRENLPIKERNAAVCVIKHWSEDKYLCLNWKSNGWHGFVVGGIEAGEDAAQAGKREIQEETGYKNAKFIKKLGTKVHAKFYHEIKNINRFAHFDGMYFELENGEQDTVSEEEHAIHTIHWISKDEVERFLNVQDMKIFWRRVIEKEQAYTGHGMLVNSNEFSGMDSEIALTKIAEKYGKIKVTYKLRDWVFSRQRYWGEPIPMVYCEHCAHVKQKVLIIHGFEGNAHNNWFPWMKQELEKRGFEVRVPTMTTSKNPELKSWMKELEPHIKDFDQNDIIIGHSLGSKAALHLLEKTKKKIGALYLVASAIGTLETRDWDEFKKRWKGTSDIEALRKFWLTKINLEKASSYAQKVVAIRSEDDPNIQAKTHSNIPSTWDYQVWNGYQHFNMKQVPELLNAILEAKNTGWVPVPEKDLPVKLPDIKNYVPTDTGESPLASIKDWVNTECPVCKSPAKRETDTMPNWAGSSWYYLRYTDPENKKAFADRKKLDYWIPVDWYNGGMEHTTLHLLYSRFWHKFLFDIGKVPTSEPYKKRTSHGLILAEGGVKMSKSLGNVVNPDSIIDSYGADTLRLYEMFMGPFSQSVSWSTDGIVGPRRFLERVWKLQERVDERTTVPSLNNALQKLIKKITNDIEAMQFNTAVSAFMIMANELEKAEHIPIKVFESFLKLLAPFAPHITEELWSELGHKKSIHLEKWPSFDASKITEEQVTIVVQVNGKVRGDFKAEAGISEEEAVAKVKALGEVQKWTEGKQIKKIIFVKGKLINIVVG